MRFDETHHPVMIGGERRSLKPTIARWSRMTQPWWHVHVANENRCRMKFMTTKRTSGPVHGDIVLTCLFLSAACVSPASGPGSYGTHQHWRPTLPRSRGPNFRHIPMSPYWQSSAPGSSMEVPQTRCTIQAAQVGLVHKAVSIKQGRLPRNLSSKAIMSQIPKFMRTSGNEKKAPDFT